jgi:hypothetical protein
MCLSSEATTVETDSSIESPPVEFEVEMATQSFGDTIPCPTPDWKELDPE